MLDEIMENRGRVCQAGGEEEMCLENCHSNVARDPAFAHYR